MLVSFTSHAQAAVMLEVLNHAFTAQAMPTRVLYISSRPFKHHQLHAISCPCGTFWTF